VIFHAGRSGIEPESIRPCADPALRTGDDGTRASTCSDTLARDVEMRCRCPATANVLARHRLPGATQLALLTASDTNAGIRERSPSYPLAATSKVLLVTEARPAARRDPGGNAERVHGSPPHASG
jgi:hypothetical protein